MTDPVDNIDAFIIVVGNEKGGTGKTTTSMHLLVQMLYEGYQVSSVDIDPRQRTLSRYIENRRKFIVEQGVELPFPSHFVVNRSTLDSAKEAEVDEHQRLGACLQNAAQNSDIILIDAPGSYNSLSRAAHSYADLIVTPINDSFFDLDVLGHVNKDTLKLEKPGVYSEMVWEAKMNRAKRTRDEIGWVVIRNRLTNIDAANKRNIAEALKNISQRLGCSIAQGLTERVIYKELFLKGIALLDIFNLKDAVKIRPSHLAARQELRDLLQFLDIPGRVETKRLQQQNQAMMAAAMQKNTVSAEEIKETEPEMPPISELLEQEQGATGEVSELAAQAQEVITSQEASETDDPESNWEDAPLADEASLEMETADFGNQEVEVSEDQESVGVSALDAALATAQDILKEAEVNGFELADDDEACSSDAPVLDSVTDELNAMLAEAPAEQEGSDDGVSVEEEQSVNDMLPDIRAEIEGGEEAVMQALETESVAPAEEATPEAAEEPVAVEAEAEAVPDANQEAPFEAVAEAEEPQAQEAILADVPSEEAQKALAEEAEATDVADSVAALPENPTDEDIERLLQSTEEPFEEPAVEELAMDAGEAAQAEEIVDEVQPAAEEIAPAEASQETAPVAEAPSEANKEETLPPPETPPAEAEAAPVEPESAETGTA